MSNQIFNPFGSPEKYQASRFMQELEKRVLVYDGAMGTQLMERNLTTDDYGGEQYHGCNEYLVLTRPDVIEEIHSAYFSAGADVVESNSFTGSRIKLDEYKLGHLTYEINFHAAQIARRVADRFTAADPSRPRFVAGSIGPTGFLPSSEDPTLGGVTFDQLKETYAEQSKALIEGGADVLLIETSQDILEVKAAIFGIREAILQTGKWAPIQAQVSVLDGNGRMLLGTDIAAVMVTLESLRADIIGLNCAVGPDLMREPLRYLSEHSKIKLSCLPNAGLPINERGRTVYPLQAVPMAEILKEFVEELGINIVGTCCGSTPDYTAELAKQVWGHEKPARKVQAEPLVSSGIRATSLLQNPPPMLVGERVNSTGSKKVRQLLLADDYDGLMTIAREQVEGGAHTLDVQVALTERTDEAEQMRRTVKKLSTAIEAPLVIDSTEADVIEAALKAAPGRCIINSINMERGTERIEAIMPLARDHGAAVIALTIDEEGMAHTAERKFEIATRIRQIVHENYDLPDNALIFDLLTFPLTTGQEDLREDAYQTLLGIKRIKETYPEVLTILGVSNVSFGVAQRARAVLNSMFLHHAVQYGLDMAIVNPSHITPYAEIPDEQRKLCDDLIFNRDQDALPRFIEFFEKNTSAGVKAEAENATAGMSVAEKLHYQILHRKKEGIEELVDAEVENRGAVPVLNEVLLPAMKEVGDKFGAGELILPFVLQSAEVMKKAVARLEIYLEKKEGYTKGKVVLATVFGDVHDIGKSLVNTILTNNGYTVYDLGKQVPVNTIIEKAVEVGADAIGLSALLVSTSKQMPLCVQELQRRGLDFPVMIGGAAINRAFGYRTNFVNNNPETPYTPGIFYCKDAFEGLSVIDKLTDKAASAQFKNQLLIEAHASILKEHERDVRLAQTHARQEAEAAANATLNGSVRPSGVEDLKQLPEPPFWGYCTLKQLPLEQLFDLLDKNTLFRLHWGGGSSKKKLEGGYDALVKDEFEPLLAELRESAEREGFLAPKAIYGYFPCHAEGEEVVIYDPENKQHELTRFSFPRQPGGEKLCLADYFATTQTAYGKYDVIPLQVVTAGHVASEYCERLNKQGDYSRAYFVHGLASSIAEAAAEYLNRQIIAELSLHEGQGKRYSWGYPACPDLEDQQKLFQLMPVTSEIGVSITEAHQLDPEQSTAALVVHHSGAKYYSTLDRESLSRL
ncbi:methionine synthase [Candidatus Chlorohelix sp.]|uniref:methionine synthase n=1 Tax=Candidatus Chlorohelix sp. TaxID=3139201 RepID=UPI00305AEDE4